MTRPTLDYRPPGTAPRISRNWTLIVVCAVILAFLAYVTAMLVYRDSLSPVGAALILSFPTFGFLYECCYEHPRRLRRARSATSSGRAP